MQNNDKQISAMFDAIDHLRRAWHGLTPCEYLSKSQFGTLMAIHHLMKNSENEAVRVSDLSNFMHQSPAALSQRIKVLEELGNIERISDKSDRRTSAVRLSIAGEKQLEDAKSVFRMRMQGVIDKLGDEETNQLIYSLNLLSSAIEATIESEGE